jgi:hypothetical protein
MARPNKPSALDWLFCVGILLLGGGFLGIYVFSRLYGTTPENELTLAEGQPTNIELSQLTGSYGARTDYLKFAVAQYRTEYASDQPKYQEVLSAVQSGEPIQVWVSTKQETVFPRQGWVPLYKLSFEGRAILTYSEVVADKSQGSRAVLIGGSVVLAIGTWGVYLCIRNRRRYAAGVGTVADGRSPAEEFGGTQDQMKKVTRTAIFLSLIVYATTIGVNFDSKVRAKQVEAFGDTPLGLPVFLVVAFVETVLFIPMPWVFWHTIRLSFQARQDGRSIGFIYLLTVSSFHPHLRRSQIVCIGGLFYFVVICCTWIVFAAVRGI